MRQSPELPPTPGTFASGSTKSAFASGRSKTAIWCEQSLWSAGRTGSEKFENLHEPVAVRLNERSVGILGQCQRNPMSGQAVLKDATVMNDFCIMDLWERDSLYGTPEDLVNDPYVFKIVPLPLRTWIYHFYFGKSECVAKLAGASGVMELVLSQKVIDAELIAGRWSPALCVVPSAFVAIFTADFVTALSCIIFGLFNITVSVLSNTPTAFRNVRWFTIGPRFIFFIFMWVRLFQHTADGAIVILSYLVIVALLSVDLLVGDLKAALGLGSQCHYEVMKPLPSRLFVCKKHGAAFTEDSDGRREISQMVTGTSHFEGMVLIAEVRGIIVQLKRLNEKEWRSMIEETATSGEPAVFIGLNIFNSSRRTLYDVEAGVLAQVTANKKAAAKQNQKGDNLIE